MSAALAPLELRAQVVAEARRWIGTPFVHAGGVRGAGADCLMLTVRVYQACGLVPLAYRPPIYPRDWFLHRGDHRYSEGLRAYFDERPPAGFLPGDLALFRVARAPAHLVIVSDWPRVIHADREAGVLEAPVPESLQRRLVSRWVPRV